MLFSSFFTIYYNFSLRLYQSSCYRCVHLLVASPNVIVATSQKGQECLPSIEGARASCPPQIHRHHHEQAPQPEQRLGAQQIRRELELLKRKIHLTILYSESGSRSSKQRMPLDCHRHIRNKLSKALYVYY